jgi:hypothetical protein
MTRRDVNWLVTRAAATSGAAAFLAPWLAAHQTHHHSAAPPDPHDWSAYHPKFFSPEEFQWLESFTAILIPTDDTPGAHEAHVASFIDFVVNAAAEFASEVQDQWRDAMSWLRSSNFGKLSAEQQLALITDASGAGSSHATAYQLIKELAVRAFYTSRVGLVDVLEYQGIAYLTGFPACTHPEHAEI